MELQLGLALSLIPTQMISSCFDLKQAMVSSQHGYSGSNEYSGPSLKRKRRTFNIRDQKSTDDQLAPLLSFQHNHPNQEEDDDDHENHSSTANNRNEDEDEDGVVGWPPIKSKRQAVVGDEDDENSRIRRRRRSSYVKVKMEGAAIARKVDLSQHNSFAALSTTLLSMFGFTGRGCNKSSNYVLTYQDKDGDWLLADDVPWRSFLESVQRLKLQRCL